MYLSAFQLENNAAKNLALEMQYNSAYAQYIEASQKMVEEMESAQEENSVENQEKGNENEERWQVEDRSSAQVSTI